MNLIVAWLYVWGAVGVLSMVLWIHQAEGSTMDVPKAIALTMLWPVLVPVFAIRYVVDIWLLALKARNEQ